MHDEHGNKIDVPGTVAPDPDQERRDREAREAEQERYDSEQRELRERSERDQSPTQTWPDTDTSGT